MSDTTNTITDFLVVGAGLAGLAFAGDVQAKGATVRLLDKGRGVGGRMATRRWADVRVDHGAQFFTAKGERFQAVVQDALADGWLKIWCHGFPVWRDGIIHEREPGHPRYAPPSGMNELAKRLATGLDVRTGATVTEITRADNGIYTARTEDGQTFSGNALILNLPPIQLRNLASPLLSPAMDAAIAATAFLPAWTLMARLETDVPGATWPAIEFDSHPVLGLVARDHTRRGPDAPPVLIAHGSGEWSQAHLEDPPETVQAALLAALQDVLGPLAVRETQTHRWRYATPTQLVPEKSLWDSERRIGACGDWCGGPRVEGAMESGWALGVGR